MAKTTNIECSGCKISMFCGRRNKETSQPCETNLRAVGVAFVIPLMCIVLVLALAHDRIGEGWTALIILVVLAVYFLGIRLWKPDFSGGPK
ncbi:MAG: SoxR reducing system RseC family protein [Bacteroides sp.]|nr:SoxR reducing system RseC family protein [Bacteroides sp.]MCM1446750.1 SoxR reducing system RseC family protein [Bacteroides sp.]